MRKVPSSPGTPALLALLLLGSLLMAALPSGAQVATGYDDTAYGWSFPGEGTFPGASADDPAGDLAFAVDAQAVPLGATPVQRAFDLTELRVDEPDAETLRFRLKVAELDAHSYIAQNVLFGSGYQIDFDVSGRAYQVDGYLWVTCSEQVSGLCESLSDPQLVYVAQLYAVTEAGRDLIGLVPSQVLEGEGIIDVLVPRWALDRPGEGAAPYLGDRITEVVVRAEASAFCITGSMGCVGSKDRLPDDGALTDLHTLTSDSNGARVRIVDLSADPAEEEGPENGAFWGGPLVPRVLRKDVEAAEQIRFPVHVQNLMDHKMLIRPTVTAADGGALAEVTVPQTLEIPGGETRPLLITLQGDALTPQEPLELRVAFETLGTTFPMQDVIRVTVRAVPPLGPDNNRLYLHTFGGDTLDLAAHGIDRLQRAEGVLNTRPDDPRDNGKGVVMHDLCLCVNAAYGWTGESTLSRPVALDNASGAVFHMTIEAPVAGRLYVEGNLYFGDTHVTTLDGVVDLAQGSNEVEVEGTIDEDALDLTAGGGPFYLDLRKIFSPGGLPLTELVGIVEDVNPRMQTQGATWIELPIIDPVERFEEAAHLTVGKARGTSLLQHVNPGKTALWNITITNQANENDTVRLDVDTPSGWDGAVAPGKSYRLGPGESVTVGVFATAPSDAKEGDEARPELRVASELGDGATTGISLVAVVTKGVEISEPSFRPDNETKARHTGKTMTEEGPGVAVIPLVAIALILLTRIRTPRGKHLPPAP